ncbi:MAG: hypothetical protein BroJett030_05230 [Alphaproteobacteria bacterium]|nr:MAG: hypothetical protein BroJett030_05230 [Alphaproteobacteria bacterium]
MSTQAFELSRQASEFARRAMEIQSGHLADVRRKSAIWTVLSQPAFGASAALATPSVAIDSPKGKKKKKKDRKARKAKKRNGK